AIVNEDVHRERRLPEAVYYRGKEMISLFSSLVSQETHGNPAVGASFPFADRPQAGMNGRHGLDWQLQETRILRRCGLVESEKQQTIAAVYVETGGGFTVEFRLKRPPAVEESGLHGGAGRRSEFCDHEWGGPRGKQLDPEREAS